MVQLIQCATQVAIFSLSWSLKKISNSKNINWSSNLEETIVIIWNWRVRITKSAHLLPMHPFSTALKTEKVFWCFQLFWCFQEVEKGWIGTNWLKLFPKKKKQLQFLITLLSWRSHFVEARQQIHVSQFAISDTVLKTYDCTCFSYMKKLQCKKVLLSVRHAHSITRIFQTVASLRW